MRVGTEEIGEGVGDNVGPSDVQYTGHGGHIQWVGVALEETLEVAMMSGKHDILWRNNTSITCSFVPSPHRERRE